LRIGAPALEPEPELELKPIEPLAPLPPVVEPGAPTKKKRPPEPQPEPHPTARWWYEWTYRGFELCRKGLFWCFWLSLCLLFLPLLYAALGSFGVGLLTGGLLALVILLGLGYILLLLLRLVLLTFFFARFSLGQFMLAILLAGFAVSLIVVLDGYWKFFPTLGLMLLFMIVAVYVGSYDPFDRDKILPPIAREVLFNPPDAPPRPAPVMDDEDEEPPAAPKPPAQRD
jgi:hypothetical protein